MKLENTRTAICVVMFFKTLKDIWNLLFLLPLNMLMMYYLPMFWYLYKNPKIAPRADEDSIKTKVPIGKY